MSTHRRFFHVLLLLLLFLLLSDSVFSTLSLLPTTSSSSSSYSYHWKSPPARRSSRPQIYGSEERHFLSVDGFVKPEPDSGTSGPPYAELVGGVQSEEMGEGREGQLELEGGTVRGLGGKAGESRGLVRVDEGEKSWGEDAKRKWGQNSMGVWGKRERRKWGENSMRVWGKRTSPDDGGNEKRKWGENTMGVWGKRSPEEKDKKEKKEKELVAETGITPSGNKPEVTGSSDGQTGSGSSNAHRLRKRSVFDWYSDDLDRDLDLGRDLDRVHDLYKRSQQARRRSYPRPYDGPKRNWETNTMKVWGKRNYPTPWEEEEEEHGEEYYDDTGPIYGSKRKWTSDNAIRIWG